MHYLRYCVLINLDFFVLNSDVGSVVAVENLGSFWFNWKRTSRSFLVLFKGLLVL